MLGDTRTNAGWDNVSVFRKLRVFGKAGERVMGLASSGNLSVSQSVISTLNEGKKNETGDLETLTNAPTMFQAAQRIGEAVRKVHLNEGRSPQDNDPKFSVSFLFGGQIQDDRMRLFLIYDEGNFIESTVDTPYLQIGEHKYGKPVLDRAITYDLDLRTALKIGLISIDSTMRSNLAVGLPIDVLVLPRNTLNPELEYRIKPGDAYFNNLRESWSKALRAAHTAIEPAPYETTATRKLSAAVLTDIDPEEPVD